MSNEEIKSGAESRKSSRNKFIFGIVFFVTIAVSAIIFNVFPGSPLNDTAENGLVAEEPSEEEADKKPEPPELTTTTYAVVEVDVLRLRNGPGTDFEILDRLSRGAYLEVMGYQNEWIEVEAPDGTHGWVHGEYTDEHKRYDPVYSSGDYYDPDRPILISYWRPGDEYWYEYGYESYWCVGEMKMDFSLRFSDIIELMGEPDLLEEEAVLEDTHHLITMEYPFMNITCHYSTSQTYGTARDDAYIVAIDVHSPEVEGPRGIRVGDSLDTLLSKVPVEQNPLEELDYNNGNDEESAYYKKVIYGSYDETAPIAVVYYNINEEPLRVDFHDMPFGGHSNGSLSIKFIDGKIASFQIGWQYM